MGCIDSNKTGGVPHIHIPVCDIIPESFYKRNNTKAISVLC